jgi:predicted dienelactone hydrolase
VAAGRRRIAVAAVLTAVVLAACGGGDEGIQDESSSMPGARLGVGVRTETFVDQSRPTPPIGGEGKPTRTLETRIYYPAAGVAGGQPQTDVGARKKGAPFPLIVFAHGSGVSSPVRYELLYRAWVANGYVVAAPTFPLSAGQVEEGGRDLVNQPADVSFVISELMRRSADQASPYAGLVDSQRVAVGGHSLGAVTALAAGHNRCCVDLRVKATLVFAGATWDAFDGAWFEGMRTPLLMVQGSEDRQIRLADAQRAFAAAPPPKAMVTVVGGDHTRPFAGGPAQETERLQGTPNEDTRATMVATLGFLDRFLNGRTAALAEMREALADEVRIKLEIVEA